MSKPTTSEAQAPHEEPAPSLTPTSDKLAAIRDDLLTARLNDADNHTRQAIWDAAAKVEAARRRAASAEKKGPR